MLIICGFLLSSGVANGELESYQHIKFSVSKYPSEQSAVITLLLRQGELQEADIPKIEIHISKIDINYDGILDVVSLVGGAGFSGTAGHRTDVFIVSRAGQWRHIWYRVTYGMMAFLKESHNGYRDLVIVGFGGHTHTKEGFHVLVWNGREYVYDRTEPLTVGEWEVFDD